VANSNIPHTFIQTSMPLHCFFNENELQPHKAYKRSEKWTKKKQEEFLDSLLRRDYVPAIVLRELDFLPDEMTLPRSVSYSFEILDGRQRIKTIQKFLSAKIETPQSLKTCKSFYNYGTAKQRHGLPIISGFLFDYPPPLRHYVNYIITLNTVIISGIGDKNNEDHEATALKIFQKMHQNK
jgi:hypothetical protein